MSDAVGLVEPVQTTYMRTGDEEGGNDVPMDTVHSYTTLPPDPRTFPNSVTAYLRTEGHLNSVI